MHSLIHYIYASVERTPLTKDELFALLKKSRARNAKRGITGILLHTGHCFFQILEGDAAQVDALVAAITQDPQHCDMVTIIREPISRRTFDGWSMGFADLRSEELAEMLGVNDFFETASCFQRLDPGRAKNILKAFREGRWRGRVRTTALATDFPESEPKVILPIATREVKFSFAFQPIIDRINRRTVSFGVQLRGQANESADTIFQKLSSAEWEHLDTECRIRAIEMATRLGLTCNLHVPLLARTLSDAQDALRATFLIAESEHLDPGRVILEVDRERFQAEPEFMAQTVREYRALGLKVCLNEVDCDPSGLALIEEIHPDMISLGGKLVHGIAREYSREAGIRNLIQTCRKQEIEVLVKHVKTEDDYHWFCAEGITLFQGDLIAAPSFERLPRAVFPE